ncbi:MAG: site-specific DNA-methyltransferase [Firmicutes bacterium]|nr:site-specific DNA-methyltransferase [Bacillota bacterium]
MANLSKQKRDRMLAFLEELKKTHNDDASIRAFNEIENYIREKKYGLVWEEHTEEVDEILTTHIPVFCEDKERRICKDENLPWNFIIEGDNLQALYLLEKTHRGKVDCIYIDPPYNTGAKDWKYNNDYVDGNDAYRHSKWLSMMKNRLLLAKHLLNPENSVLICTIDEKEYIRLGCILEELFPNALIQMIATQITPQGNPRVQQFYRTSEYIYFLEFGKAQPSPLALQPCWRTGLRESSPKSIIWGSLLRTGTERKREDRPFMFYPFFIKNTPEGPIIHSIGEPYLDEDLSKVNKPEGTTVVWPIGKNKELRRWQVSANSARQLKDTGFLRLGKWNSEKTAIQYIAETNRINIEKGVIPIQGRNYDGSYIINDNYEATFIPGTVWKIPSHDATRFGTQLLTKVIGQKRFDYPKSLYAVRDALRFFVSNNPNAVILDFFAGSGTTLHAVNLLNAEDEGNRRCIMVTNNEVSLEEEKKLTKNGFKKGDPEWEALGIAQYVTWPRTVCSINGKDIQGQPLKGDYPVNDINGNPLPMAQGFTANVKYFKCDWTQRKPDDYLLSNALCLHIKEMIELETGREIDGKKNVLILNQDDFNTYISNAKAYPQIENIWVNQNMIFSSAELKLLSDKGFKYIPREYFGHELKEAAE